MKTLLLWLAFAGVALGQTGNLPSATGTVGPNSSTATDAAVFADTTGRTLSDSGVPLLYNGSTSSITIGTGSGNSGSIGQANYLLGYQTGISLATSGITQPQADVFIGYQAGKLCTTCRELVAIGYQSAAAYTGTGAAAEDGLGVCVGSFSCASMTANGSIAADVVMIGQKAGLADVTPNGDVIIGVHAADAVVASSGNVLIGHSVAHIPTTPGLSLNNSTLVGSGVMGSAPSTGTVTNITGVGYNALLNLAAGAQSVTSIGDNSGQNSSTAARDVYVGSNTGSSNTTGTDLIFIGSGAGYNSQVQTPFATGTIAIGSSAMAGSNVFSGNNFTCVGYQCGNAMSSGTNDSFFGYQAGESVSTGVNISIFGSLAGASLTTGQVDTFIGYNAGHVASTASNDTLVGSSSATNLSTGTSNTIIGAATAGSCTTCALSTLVGYNSDLGSAVTDVNIFGNQITATNSALPNTSHSMQLGSNTVTLTTLNGAVTTPALTSPSVSAAGLATPSAPVSITQTGTAGSTTDTYLVVGRAVNSTGYYSAASATTTTATANATLNSTNYNKINFPQFPAGTTCFDVYRTVAAGTPSTTGKIASCITATSYSDQGAAGDSSTAPNAPSGGYLFDAVYLVANLPATCTAGQKANVSDALAPTYLGALTGGSTTFTPVVCKGSNSWISY